MFDHQPQPQAFGLGLAHWHANQAASKASHEVDVLSLHMLSGHDEVALVFAILIVNQYDHFTEADVFDNVFNLV
ncbi:hypothetical protein D9M70_648630 [compost metagenome]